MGCRGEGSISFGPCVDMLSRLLCINTSQVHTLVVDNLLCAAAWALSFLCSSLLRFMIKFHLQ